MKLLLFIGVLSTALTSCYTYKVFPKEYRAFEYKGEKETAFVINPELKKEYEILKQSGIFILTSDSLNDKAVKIELHPLFRGFMCGNAIVLSAFSLGQFPVYFPDTYHFKFEEMERQETRSRDFELQVAKRIWFWDMFALNKNFKGKAGKALLANYYKK
jgi:hypothetical protein